MVNIGFLRTFRGPKGQFPAKYHISGHYIEYLRILKNRIFCHFSRFFRIFSMYFAAGIGRNQSNRPEIIINVFLKLFRCLFIYKSFVYDRQIIIHGLFFKTHFSGFFAIFDFWLILSLKSARNRKLQKIPKMRFQEQAINYDLAIVYR